MQTTLQSIVYKSFEKGVLYFLRPGSKGLSAHILGLPEAWSGKRFQQVCSTEKLQLSLSTALIHHLLLQVSQHLHCLCPTRLL